jgi:CHRD domain
MQRPRLAILVALVALIAMPSAAAAVDPTQPAYGGPMTGAQEVPAVVTTATGQGTAVISADGSTITYIVTYSGLSGTVNASHIHTGAAGVAGGVILPLTPGPSPMSGTLTAANFTASGSVTTFAQAVAAIRAGTTYFNLHTTANPGGEIRGQILAAGDAYFADLNGHQENPDVATAATGKGIAVISADASTVTYLITYSGLSGTVNASHIHTGAVGSNGGVILPITPGPSPMSGTLTAATFTASGPVTTFAEAIAAIRAGTTYFNLHTTANPGGEIRGQIGVTVAAPAPTPAPTPAPPAPTEEPAPTAEVTVPPTSVSGPGTPVAPAASLGLMALVGLLAAAGTLVWIGRRRSSMES